MPETMLFPDVDNRIARALAIDEKATAPWEAIQTSAQTAEVMTAGGRFVCTMRRDAPEDLAFILESRQLLRLLATDCQTLKAELVRLLETRDQQAAEGRAHEEGYRRALADLEAERALRSAAEDSAATLADKLQTAEASLQSLRAEVEELTSGPWDQNPVIWERFRAAAAALEPRAACADCGAVTWLAYRASYCKVCRRPAGSPVLDWLSDKRPYPPQEVDPAAVQPPSAEAVFVDSRGVPHVRRRDPA